MIVAETGVDLAALLRRYEACIQEATRSIRGLERRLGCVEQVCGKLREAMRRLCWAVGAELAVMAQPPVGRGANQIKQVLHEVDDLLAEIENVLKGG